MTPGNLTTFRAGEVYNREDDNDYITIVNSTLSLIRFVKKNGWEGYDPYDGLNSTFTSRLSGKSKWARVFFVQLNKHCPVNLRSILRIKKGIHIKGMGLFASAYLKLFKVLGDEKLITEAVNCLEFLKNKSLKNLYSDHCWGDYFTYQSVRSVVRADMTKTPDIINTVVCASAFLDHYKLTGNQESLEIAISCGNFIVNSLFAENKEKAYFRYTPVSEPGEVTYNACAHGAAFLSKIHTYVNNKLMSELSQRVMDYVISKQKPDGAWYYSQINGKEVIQIDFHQGFILDDLYDFIKNFNPSNDRYTKALLKGAEFYRNEQFLSDGRSKWRWPKLYPIDIHNQAQGIITFGRLSEIEREFLHFAKKVALWTIDNMQGDKGEFYYQNWRIFTNKIPYLRWGQAWMLLALSTLLNKLSIDRKSKKNKSSTAEAAMILS